MKMLMTCFLLAAVAAYIPSTVLAEGGKNTKRVGNLICDTSVEDIANCVNDAGYDPEDCEIVDASDQSGFVIVRCDD